MNIKQEIQVMALEDLYLEALTENKLNDYPENYFTNEKLKVLGNPNYQAFTDNEMKELFNKYLN
tara:strand:+ start:608 stop:799 length:192 start_codon:yes stop_codon:yes gene_type:complete